MAFCTACGGRVADDARFCTQCGRPVPIGRGSSATGPTPDGQVPATAAVEQPPAPRPAPTAETEAVSNASDVAAAGGASSGSYAAIEAPAVGSASPRAGSLLTEIFAPRAMSRHQVVDAARVGALTIAVPLAVLFVVVAVFLATQGEEHRGAPAAWFRTAVLLLGLGVHAPAYGAFPLGTATIGAMPLLITALVLGVAAWLTARTVRRHTPPANTVLPTALVTGAVFGVVGAVLAAMAAGPLGVFGRNVDVATRVSISPWWFLLTGTLVVTLGALAGAARGWPRTGLPATLQASVGRLQNTQALDQWLTYIRLARDITVALLAVGVVVIVLQLLRGALSTHEVVPDQIGGQATGSPSAWWLLPFLPNLVIAAAGYSTGGSLVARGSALGLDSDGAGGSVPAEISSGLLVGNASFTTMLGLALIVLVGVLVAGVRGALHRSPRAAATTGWWQPAVVVALTWALFALAVRISGAAQGEIPWVGEGMASGWAGMGLPSTVLMTFAWSVLAAVAGGWLARTLAGSRPNMFARLAGRHLSPEWSLLLADAALRRAEQPHKRLAAVADDLRAGRTTPPAKPLGVDRARDRKIVGALGGLIVMLLLALGVRAFLQATVYTPQRAVTGYLDAVRSRDAGAALSHLSTAGRPQGDTPLLVSKAMGTLPEYTIEETDGNGTVRVRFAIDGTEARRTFQTVRDDAGSGLFDEYKVADGLSDISVATGEGVKDGSLTSNGVAVAGPSAVVFPGVYEVTGQPEVGYDAAKARVVALTGTEQSVTVKGSMNPKAQEAANAAVKNYVDACARQKVNQPSGCPFQHGYGTYTGVSWKVTTYPTVTVEPGGNGLSVRTDNQGHATFSGTTAPAPFTTPTPETEDVSFDVSGTLEWDGKDPATARLVPPDAN